jgi:hypothetical protein
LETPNFLLRFIALLFQKKGFQKRGFKKWVSKRGFPKGQADGLAVDNPIVGKALLE